ncbi:ABC transporter ATP-binding protein [candidate division WOR-1 bacterium RIFOXYC2_FULL_37_10]|uniref:ABC transporter ATP-binding protein n=1 Tax=candidate division WOR-1 bacterium RIFOXYB2_FULL_37_13 TaxID=1802579 RepID=A0A1F4SV10_UNCSA|nr:MAG: ABC transporter ATP-binding protein [candidate division WOR-1 bacterium RIFOXYA2_FULL_37_7]OGC24278.1 MAG: ABC transporter ATP-binding protein [candidate division WOR-1 bacterium RIFOXYB2_FULL_37_13]OGC36392.1 MAG: ABC transporter ATP-binding protein [candidate division WOR-1 bacterium RIFOXYC2_FULL_37_10]
MIKIEKITKKYGKLMVLEEANLEIIESQSLAIIGPSGCGKSTLLRLILKLENLTSGKIIVENNDISLLGEEELISFRKKIGMVFQYSALFDSMSVFENVAFALREHTQLTEREIQQIVNKKLDMVGLLDKGNIMPAELSGGMQKRVGIARALAFDPKIILYDEPTTGLDPITSTHIENLINDLAKKLKVTSIIVTHQLSTIFRTSDRIAMLHNGKFIEAGTVSEAKNSKNIIIKEFINAGIEKT